MPAMCWRKVSKFKSTVLTLLFYITVYIVLSYAITPKVTVSFLSDEYRIGDKYVLLYLDSPGTPVFTDADGAKVFESRRCERCFITNNIGFLPLQEYDAVLVVGDEKTEMSFIENDRKYHIATSENCIRKKFNGCSEPKIKSLITIDVFDLCELCVYLHSKKKPEL